MSEHALLSPSKAGRRMQCPGSRKMELLYPDVPGPSAIEGTFAHTVAAERLLGGEVPAGATAEMIEGSEIWEDVFGKFRPHIHIEERMESGLHPDCWGTPDAWAYDAPTKTIHLGDYKFGHRVVAVENNWQLLTYLHGAMAQCTGAERAVLYIVMPRCFQLEKPVQVWEVALPDLAQKFEHLKLNCVLAMKEQTYCRTGPECLYCKARHSCPTLAEASYALMEIMGQNAPFNLSVAALSAEYKMLQDATMLLKARLSGIEHELLAKVQGGATDTGWALKRTYGRETWRSVQQALALGKLMGIDISKEDAVTPKQAIKLGLDAELVRAYSVISESGFKLVPDDGAAASKAFGGNI